MSRNRQPSGGSTNPEPDRQQRINSLRTESNRISLLLTVRPARANIDNIERIIPMYQSLLKICPDCIRCGDEEMMIWGVAAASIAGRDDPVDKERTRSAQRKWDEGQPMRARFIAHVQGRLEILEDALQSFKDNQPEQFQRKMAMIMVKR
jgi:hypothetical protein